MDNNLLTIGSNSVMYFDDSLQGIIKYIDDNSVHLIFTSPPYFNYIYYGKSGIGNEMNYDEYIDNLVNIFKVCLFKLIVGGRLVINITNLTSKNDKINGNHIHPIIPDLVTELNQLGYIFFDECIWIKAKSYGGVNGRPLFGSYPYPPTPKLMNAMYENILVFRVPGKREQVPTEIKEQSKISLDDWRTYTNGLWRIKPDRNKYHPASFPMELAERVIKLYSFVGDSVLDPFAGTGTSVIAAEILNRKGIGFEINSDFRSVAQVKASKHINEFLL